MLPLTNTIRDYAWGSREGIAAIQVRPVPSPGPEAELWIGAHPSAPSLVDGRLALDGVIASAPSYYLGQQAVARFGERLPYLLKVLAAEHPLSLQAHPDRQRAKAGFKRADRSYVDDNHKPELLVALTQFEALCGFRDPADSARLLSGLGIVELDPVVAALSDGQLEHAVTRLLSWPEHERQDIVKAASASNELAWRLAQRYPSDIGVIVTLLLNHVQLAPGEAIYMPAGNLHAYLAGVGIEVMAASDNVLRGGLTSKPVNVPELLAVLDYRRLSEPIVRAVPAGAGVVTWPVTVPDFRLHRVTVDERSPVSIDPSGPRALICTKGTATVTDAGGTIHLPAGAAAFSAAEAGTITLTGDADVFIASAGDSHRRLPAGSSVSRCTHVGSTSPRTI